MDGTKLDGKTVAEHIVDFLERREIDHVFGLCGHTNIAVLAALARQARLISSPSAMSRSQAMPLMPTPACRAARRSCCHTFLPG